MHRKISTLIAAITIVLLTVTATFSALQIIYPTQKVYGNPAITSSVSMSPMTLTLGTLPETDTYWVNITSSGLTQATDYINIVCIQLPTNWTYEGGAVGSLNGGYGFAVSAIGNGWVNFTNSPSELFYDGAIANFSIPAQVSTIPTVGTWNIYCYQGTTLTSSGPATITVTDNLQFHSTMTPNYVMNGTSYIYTITITNDLCPIGINKINVTFPSNGWSFNVLMEYSPLTWTVAYNSVNTFLLSGPNILEGNAVSIMVNMTVPVGVGGIFSWLVGALSSTGGFLGNYSMTAVVDNTKPTITVINPNVAYYSDGSGNYVWINVTVHDTPNMAAYFSGYFVGINDTTRFAPYPLQPYLEVDAYDYDFYYVNITAIPDGHLAVLITAIDPAGNTGNATAQTTVDNTAPALIELYVYGYDTTIGGVYTLHQDISGTYWMTANTTNIFIYAAYSNPSGFTGNVYFNSSSYPFTNYNYIPGYGVGGYHVPVPGPVLVTLNITLIDTSSPTANRYSSAWTIERETTLPSVPSYTKTTTICGGFIIYGLTATDIVGINSYNIYFNGTLWAAIAPYGLDSLNSSTLYWPYYATIGNITVLDLFDEYHLAGEVANITINAVNYGSNVGPSITFFVTVQAGQWYPLELYPKWNLISLPLMPYSTATSDIYSLLLLHGASGVNFAYSFDNVAKTWTLNPTSMADGNGYWIDMNAYDVLIVQGYPIWAPPGSPPPIVEYSLTTGWNLAGFTETDWWYGYEYVASLQYTSALQSYFRYAYVWDAADQYWYTVDLLGTYGTTYFNPGQGFYIYTYSSQTLIPPT